MIVDTSALIALLANEPYSDKYAKVLVEADVVSISAATWLETAIVVGANEDPVENGRLDDLVREIGADIEPFTLKQAELARNAYRLFGRGSGHPAKLNFGDCFAYALAREKGEPLLFKGSDFSQTDVTSALD